MDATATRRKKKLVRKVLCEDFTSVPRGTSPYKVDREAGIIYGVKVLGTHSKNNRIYTIEAMEAALPMYEGLAVNIDHPHDSDGKLKPDAYREVHKVFGTLRRVRVEEDGMRADLEYNRHHPMADMICEFAERMPERIGLSHNAEGAGDTKDGILIVNQILEVRSVDIVAEPGTVSSLFESREPAMKKKVTVRRLLERRIYTATPEKQARLRRILEDIAATRNDKLEADDPDEKEKTTEADDGEPDDSHKKDLLNAFTKMVDSDDEHDGKMVNSIVKYLKGPPKIATEEDESEPDDEPGKTKTPEDIDNKSPTDTIGGVLTGDTPGSKPGTGKDNPPETNDKFESLQRKVRDMERKEKARELCESAGINPDKEFLSTLMLLPEAQMKSLIAREKARGPVQPKGSGARSGSFLESRQSMGEPAKDAKDFALKICG